MTAVYPQHSLSLCLRSPGGLNWQPGFRVIARASATRSVSRDAPQVSRQLTLGHGALRHVKLDKSGKTLKFTLRDCTPV
jgi:hypothetical protein